MKPVIYRLFAPGCTIGRWKYVLSGVELAEVYTFLHLSRSSRMKSLMKRGTLAGFVLVLLLLGPSISRADRIDDLVREGLDHLYSIRFDEAADRFDKAIAADKTDPRGYFFRSTLHLWSYIFDRQPDQLDLFLKLTDQTIAVASRRIDEKSDDSRARLFLGMSYGYKAIANARAENMTAAAMSGRTCYEKLSSLIDDDPRAYDAYLGLGLFHFLFGSVPKAAQIIGGMGGIKGDAKLGLKEIETVAARGTYFRTDAQLILAMLTIYYQNDVKKGMASLESLSARYPRNVALQYAIGSAWLGQENPTKSIPYFIAVTRSDSPDFRLITDQSYNRLGHAYFAKNDLTNAKSNFQKFLQRTHEKSNQADAWYYLGLCFEVQGNRDNAVKSYKRAIESPSPGQEDISARRRAHERIKTPLDATDILLIRATNSVGARDTDEAIKLAMAAFNNKNLTPGQNALAWYTLGRSFQLRGDCNRAINGFRLATTNTKHSETWVAPFSYYHMGECYLATGDRDRWKRSMALARNSHLYDNEPQLRFLIERDVTIISN